MSSAWEEYAQGGATTHEFNPWSGGPQLQRQALLPRSSSHLNASITRSSTRSSTFDPRSEVTEEDLLHERDKEIEGIEKEMRELQPLWIEVATLVVRLYTLYYNYME